MSDGEEPPDTAPTPPTAQPPQVPQATPSPLSPEVAQAAQPSQTGDGLPHADADAAGVGDAVGPTSGAKMVRRVVCGYRLGWLPGDWLQTWRRLDRLFARSGLNVQATLAPLEDLPTDTDILVVPPELRGAAR